MKLDISQYRLAYLRQKNNANQRGIEFLLSFQEWTNFWGDDIDRRGSGECDLQMQRIADTGPYALWNIKKGVPKQNSATYSKMCAKRKCEKAAEDLQIALDMMMNEPCAEDIPEISDDEIFFRRLGVRSSRNMFSGWFFDKVR